MKYNPLVKIAWRSVLRNWRHSLGTLLSISIGFMAVSLFDGFVQEIQWQGLEGYGVRGMLGDVIIERKGAVENWAEDPWSYSLTLKEQQFLENFFREDPDVEERVRFLNISGMVSNGRNSAVFVGTAYDILPGLALRGETWAWNTKVGKPLHLAPPTSVILAQGLGTLMECEPQSKVPYLNPKGGFLPVERPFHCYNRRIQLSATTENAQANALEAQVVGLAEMGLRSLELRYVSLPIELAQRLVDTDKITRMSVKLKSKGSSMFSFIERLRKASASQGFALNIQPWTEHPIAEALIGGLKITSVFRSLFMTIVIILGTMLVANTTIKAVDQRSQEINTLRNLGFLRKNIIFLFSTEGLFLSLIGSAIGLIGTLGLTWAVNAAHLTYRAGLLSTPLPLKIQYAFTSWFLSTLTLTLLCTGTAWLCSRNAAQTRKCPPVIVKDFTSETS